MKWLRRTNYHGARDYERENPIDALVNKPAIIFAWLLSEARRHIDKLLRSGVDPSATALLMNEERGGFSLLGTADRKPVRQRAADCPFPTQEGRTLARHEHHAAWTEQ